ncbi:MAG: DUF2804 domain-containing protein [Erysipelotrichaceae bacterium]|nr:DUF2804 domain-containing protein [Erysipelotrichaceae bacterium]
MEKLLTEPGFVLDKKGRPQPGYSTQEVLTYRRKDIKAKPFRIKEWDFYQMEDVNGQYCIQLTYGHADYIGQIGVMMFDIKNSQWIINESTLIPLAMNRMKLPESASKDNEIHYRKGKYVVDFICHDHIRDLSLKTPHFECQIHLEPQINHALIINVPFDESPRHFYYNYKLNCMKATGMVKWVDDNHEVNVISLTDNTYYGLLDWGRGVWPFSNEWFWSNGQGMVDGQLFGFNLGCGFGNTDTASENILFYEGQPHKLSQVTISHTDDYMAEWTLKDKEGRCQLTMTPEFDRITRDHILFVDNCTHQVFGRFNGKVILDDGRELIIKDLPAFAEHAVNNW